MRAAWIVRRAPTSRRSRCCCCCISASVARPPREASHTLYRCCCCNPSLFAALISRPNLSWAPALRRLRAPTLSTPEGCGDPRASSHVIHRPPAPREGGSRARNVTGQLCNSARPRACLRALVERRARFPGSGGLSHNGRYVWSPSGTRAGGRIPALLTVAHGARARVKTPRREARGRTRADDVPAHVLRARRRTGRRAQWSGRAAPIPPRPLSPRERGRNPQQRQRPEQMPGQSLCGRRASRASVH